MEIGHNPLITAGKNTFINDIIEMSGGRNIGAASAQPYPAYSAEKLIVEDPDFIIIPVQDEKSKEEMYQTDKWKSLKAVKNNNILFIDADLLSRPGPRLVDAYEVIAKFIYKKESGK